jgi:(p)ppGpp synthase/HD superfamily hydrolase
VAGSAVVPLCHSERVPAETTSPRLTSNFVEAVQYAAEKHATQTRKASDIPYLGHLLSVAGLVIEADGTETQAIAALLHDAAEDQGGEETLAEIREKFGADVATIVDECSDTFETPKPPWRQRKESYIRHLPDASDDAILVSLADKLDNARAMLRDFRAHGDELWQRFNIHDPQQHLWYYRSLLQVYTQRIDNWMVDELRDVIDALEDATDLEPA